MSGKVFKLSSGGADAVARDFTKVGAAGEKMGQTVTKGAAGIPPALRAVDNAAAQARSSFDGLAGRAGGLGQVLGALGPGGLAAAAGIGGLLAIGGAASSAAHEMLVLDGAAKQAGVSVEFLQEMQYAVRQAGREITVIEPALKTFAVRLGEIRDGIGQGSLQILQRIGISAEDVAGFKNAEDGLLKIAEAASKVDERTRFDVYDKLGIVDLVPALKDGALGFRKIADEARAAGVVISTEVVAGASQTARELDAAQKAIDVQFKQALLEAAPLLSDLAKIAADLARFMVSSADSFKDIDSQSTRTIRDRIAAIDAEQARLVRVHGEGVRTGGDVNSVNGNLPSGALSDAMAPPGSSYARNRYAVLQAERTRRQRELGRRLLDSEEAGLRASRGAGGGAGGGTVTAGGGGRAASVDPEVSRLTSIIEKMREEAVWADRLNRISRTTTGLTREESEARLRLEDTLEQITRARALGIIKTDEEAESLKRSAEARVRETEAARQSLEMKEAMARQKEKDSAQEDADKAAFANLPSTLHDEVKSAFLDARQIDWDTIKAGWARSFRQVLWDTFMGDTLKDFEQTFATVLSSVIRGGVGKAGKGSGISGGGGWVSTAVNVITSIFGKRAGGGPVYAGGSYLVGEEGPELVSFGASGYVHTASKTRGMMGGGGMVFAPTINAPGASIDAVESIKAEQRRMYAEFQQWAAGEQGRARAAVRDGDARRLRR